MHHYCPAPHCTTLVCTTFSLHHTRMHHNCPASHLRTTLLHHTPSLALYPAHSAPAPHHPHPAPHPASQPKQIAHHSVEEMLQVPPKSNPNPNRGTPPASDSGIVASSCDVEHLCGGIRLSKHHVLKILWSPLLVVPDLLLCKNTQLAWCADA